MSSQTLKSIKSEKPIPLKLHIPTANISIFLYFTKKSNHSYSENLVNRFLTSKNAA